MMVLRLADFKQRVNQGYLSVSRYKKASDIFIPEAWVMVLRLADFKQRVNQGHLSVSRYKKASDICISEA